MYYFDHSATSPTHPEVLQSYLTITERYFANPASIHKLGVASSRLLVQAKQQIKELFDIPTANGEVIFTSGGTESNNLAIFGLAYANQQKGKSLITSKIEHPSVLECFKRLETQGFSVTYLDVDQEGKVDLEQLKKALSKDTTLVSIMHVNNEVGTIQPLTQIKQLIQAHSTAIFHVDAVQSYGKLPVSLDAKNADVISISGHKINALRGSGALIMRHRYPLTPHMLGGGQESGLRSGTVAVNLAASLAKAMRLAKVNEEHAQYRKWKQAIVTAVEKMSALEIVGDKIGAPHIISIAMPKIKGEVAINFLQDREIIVSTSSACSSTQQSTSHVIEHIQLSRHLQNGVIRISFGMGNTDQQIEALIKGLNELNEFISKELSK